MEKINIGELRDILIVEKAEGNTILKGSHIYCGCCGNSIGELKKKMVFPFKAHDFLDALKNKSVEWQIFGLRHKTCRHTMFPFKDAFDFVRLDGYRKQMKVA